MNLSAFMSAHYLPYVHAEMEPSTVRGYESIWRRHAFETEVEGFRPPDAERFVHSLPRSLTRRTLIHIRSFYSGVWSYAIRTGLYERSNPWREVRVPKARESVETYAYGAEEVRAMLSVLTGQAHLAVAIAAYAGLRKSEIQGLKWEDYDGASLHIRRKVWQGREGRPKSKASRASVPCAPALKEILDRVSAPHDWMIRNASNGPADLQNLAERVIRPVLRAHGLEWHSWHPFRRSVGSRLHEAGVQDLTIQKVLRHENVSATRACYIKVDDVRARRAVETL